MKAVAKPQASDVSQRIRTAIRVTLARNDQSQKALAEALGLSVVSIHRRMTGEVAWNVDELAQVATFLEVEFLELFDVATATP